MLDAYLNDPDVVEAMASAGEPEKSSNNPSLFGWTATLSALRDLQDQMIASRGGTKFVPRPVIPGRREKLRRADEKLRGTVSRIIGSD